MSRLPAFEFMKDEEVLAWIKVKISNREAEDAVCDYKASVDLKGEGKKEILKDITGFANHLGGVLLIGVPEETLPDKTIVPSQKYGIPMEPGLDVKIEQIIRSLSAPSLPALDVRVLKIDEGSDDVLYFVYHPKSWLRPHQSLADYRYYKRGTQITEKMGEGDVEALYTERQAAKQSVQEYVRGLNFGENIITMPMALKLSVTPLPIRDGLVDFFSPAGRTLAEEHGYIPNGGNQWKPCEDGIMTHGGGSDVEDWRYIAKVFPTGTFTLLESGVPCTDNGKVSLDNLLLYIVSDYNVTFLQKLYQSLGTPSRLHVAMTLEGLQNKTLSFTRDYMPTTNLNIMRLYEQRPKFFKRDTLSLAFDISAVGFFEANGIRNAFNERFAHLVGLWEGA